MFNSTCFNLDFKTVSIYTYAHGITIVTNYIQYRQSLKIF